MPKGKLITPEKVTGLVAMSYLVLIPVGALLAYRKIQAMDQDVAEMWDRLGMPEEQKAVVDLGRFKRMFRSFTPGPTTNIYTVEREFPSDGK